MLFTMGEVLAVFLIDGGEPMIRATRYRRTVAGSESNVAAGVVRLGLPARLVTVVGRDGLGDAVEATLLGWGIDARVRRSALATGTLVRSLAAGVPAESVHLRVRSAATELSAADIDAAWSNDVTAVFVTGITAVRSGSARAAVQRCVELARHAGALVIADPNFRPTLGSPDDFAGALAGIRGHTDIAIGDLDELALLAGVGPGDAVASLLTQGCRLVVTKLGAQGAEATDGRETVHVPSYAKVVVDTVGAGDAFAAGLITALMENRTMAECLLWGSIVAAHVVSAAGDVEGLPLRSDLAAAGERAGR